MSNYAVDRQKWQAMTIFEQMGNIYSEIGRTYSARGRGDKELEQGALVRALDLFDATVEPLVAAKSPRAKEVLRSKDQFLQSLQDDDLSEMQAIDKYFMQYAIAARLPK